MGAVWEAEHSTLRSFVALKLLPPGRLSSSSAVTCFLREARAAATLRSLHVVQVLDCGACDGIPYIVMELLEGETLAARLARQGPLSPRRAAPVLSQVAQAVATAHAAGIVHRDLKPSNVFLAAASGQDGEIARVLDFGLAKRFADGCSSD